jgi:hypothetical protein
VGCYLEVGSLFDYCWIILCSRGYWEEEGEINEKSHYRW